MPGWADGQCQGGWGTPLSDGATVDITRRTSRSESEEVVETVDDIDSISQALPQPSVRNPEVEGREHLESGFSLWQQRDAGVGKGREGLKGDESGGEGRNWDMEVPS